MNVKKTKEKEMNTSVSAKTVRIIVDNSEEHSTVLPNVTKYDVHLNEDFTGGKITIEFAPNEEGVSFLTGSNTLG